MITEKDREGFRDYLQRKQQLRKSVSNVISVIALVVAIAALIVRSVT